MMTITVITTNLLNVATTRCFTNGGSQHPQFHPRNKPWHFCRVVCMPFFFKEQCKGHSCLKLNYSNSYFESYCENLVLAHESGNSFFVCLFVTPSHTPHVGNQNLEMCYKCWKLLMGLESKYAEMSHYL